MLLTKYRIIHLGVNTKTKTCRLSFLDIKSPVYWFEKSIIDNLGSHLCPMAAKIVKYREKGSSITCPVNTYNLSVVRMISMPGAISQILFVGGQQSSPKHIFLRTQKYKSFQTIE
eukprot:TRINITY_DN3456_c0_g5_i1.p1 TRINITY_DN3456_c0_g5~~TRINITY_DN3456_c0_g5_i1.p1  ORF type:complete len:115 (+),score=0.52 TRINITY_DN3456_c0_g5_i1:994-1338(+)